MNRCIYDSFGRDVGVSVSVCLHDNLKTVADICFLLGSYVVVSGMQHMAA